MEQHKQGLLHKPQIIGISLLIEKGIFGLDNLVAWVRWISGMALARVGNKGHLSMEKKYAQVQSPTRCSRNKPARKTEKKKKVRKPGCHKPTPLRINLVLEIWLLREPSQTYRPSATCRFSDFFYLLHIVPTVASNICEGVYFTRSMVLTECFPLIHH